MSHQGYHKWNSEKKYSEWHSFDDVEPKKTWDIGHFGDEEGQEGTILIKEAPTKDGSYLEVSVRGTPFFSIQSDLDQWGTWYNFKLSNDVDDPPPDAEFMYAYEWDTPSFLRALAEAIGELADRSEPRPLDKDEAS